METELVKVYAEIVKIGSALVQLNTELNSAINRANAIAEKLLRTKKVQNDEDEQPRIG